MAAHARWRVWERVLPSPFSRERLGYNDIGIIEPAALSSDFAAERLCLKNARNISLAARKHEFEILSLLSTISRAFYTWLLSLESKYACFIILHVESVEPDKTDSSCSG